MKLLPPYSPEFNAIEEAGAKVKTALRQASAGTWDALGDAVCAALKSITRHDIRGPVTHAGYRHKPGRAPL